MKVSIEIECFDNDEMLRHLSDIRKRVKNYLTSIDDGKNEDEQRTFAHNNCDGSYTADYTP